MEVSWKEGYKFISIKRQQVRLARSLWFAVHSRIAKSCSLIVELWFGFTFPFLWFSLFVVCVKLSVLDTDSSELKVLAKVAQRPSFTN